MLSANLAPVLAQVQIRNRSGQSCIEKNKLCPGWIVDHLDHDLSVATLAARVHMSQRNFARVFSRSVGVSPGAYVQALRLERARVLLETTDLRLDELARRCGFGSVDGLRHAFAQALHVSPTQYRAQVPATNVIPIAGRRGA